jgi:elongation factor Ts
MTQITAEMVKDLREKTGAGMMDCKKALMQYSDIEAAIKYLREKGLASAAKKAGRIAGEGLVSVFIKDNAAGIVELNCETDFVARNPDFQKLASDLAEQVVVSGKGTLKIGEVMSGEVLLNQSCFNDSSKTVEILINEKVGIMDEKIVLRRFMLLSGGNVYGSYVHSNGSIGAAVELIVDDAKKASSDGLKTLARDLAMHVAAAAPLGLSRSHINEKIIEAERQILLKQIMEQKKPEAIWTRILEGRLEKYFSEVCLLEQKFVKDPDFSIDQLIEKTSKETGARISLNQFMRFKVGEGIEKKTDDFIQEVSKIASC